MSYSIKRIIREKLTNKLWEDFVINFPLFDEIFNLEVILDHFAIIDFRSPHSGIEYMKNILQNIGYQHKGNGYLPQKSNHFAWLCEDDISEKSTDTCLPQIVIGDFDTSSLSIDAKNIVLKYIDSIQPLDIQRYTYLKNQIDENDFNVVEDYVELLFEYFTYKPTFKLSVSEFNLLRGQNELMAWVLAFGRTVNHFGISIHHDSKYDSLSDFNQVVAKFFKLNELGGMIKGSKYEGIEQSSSVGPNVDIALSDGSIEIPSQFLEFVWRHPLKNNPQIWSDYFRGFISNNANKVIESIYVG